MPAMPYEAQQADHACGAACLCMVYRSLGVACDQAEVRAAVTRDRRGRPRCWTHLLCQDVLRRGLAGVIVQAKEPWVGLRQCHEHSLRVVLHLRMAGHSSAGHYCVLAGIDEERVTLHDPLVGPERTLGREELLALWRPRGEVVGQILLAVGNTGLPSVCATCGSSLSPNFPCPLCRRGVALQLAEALGCADDSCPGRLWRACFCPWCDGRIEHLGEEPWRPTLKRSWRS
jgi:hypothetical protein